MQYIRSQSQGFTLVELAVVIVIIGLIIGGVIMGRDMIVQAQLRQTVTQLNEYTAAVQAFKLKYNGIPGDFANADAFGMRYDRDGVATVCQTRSTPTGYSGNGNGVLEDFNVASSLRYNGEYQNFWIHLSNLGLIKDKISRGTAPAACSANVAIGINYPAARFGKSVLLVSHNHDLYYVLGGFSDTHNIIYSSGVELHQSNIAQNLMTPQEAFMLDSKIDDGLPLQGTTRVITAYMATSSDLNTTGALQFDTFDDVTNCIFNATYNATLDTPACTLSLKQ